MFFTSLTFGQLAFKFRNASQKKQRVKFQLINNLIIIPVELNGKELKFILDSGVNKTILFNLSQNDSVGLNNVETVELRGLGGDRVVDALISKKNQVKVGKIVNENENVYVILKDYFDLSGKMGKTIHGIIGFSLIRNFVLKINYKNKTIDLYNPKYYKPNPCRKCETLPLEFYRNKPFINGTVRLDDETKEDTPVKLLIDTGGSDAIWLFEDTKPEIKTPKKYFTDILGDGLSGIIYGKRARLNRFTIAGFDLKSPTVSYLDTTTTRNARRFKERNGSIGGEILKRFIVWLDYPNRQLILKKTADFSKPFNYNMSGLDIVYSGKVLVREANMAEIKDPFNQSIPNQNSVRFVASFSYRFRSSFRIKNVVPDSPADRAGLLKDDLILRINGRPSYEFILGQILYKFQEKPNKKIKLLIQRKGRKMRFEFFLEKRV
ncbi:MAG: aspartyl protease family protein [Polaribacter sp.]